MMATVAAAVAAVAAAIVLAAAAVVEAIERLLNSFKSSATFKHVTSTCAQSQWQRKRRRAAMMAVSSVMASVAAAVATVAAAVGTRSTQAKACLCRLQPR